MPHGDFGSEVAQLRAALGGTGAHGSAYVLGDALNGLQWHVFVADAGPLRALPAPPPVYTLEICMTRLCPVKVPCVASKTLNPNTDPMSSVVFFVLRQLCAGVAFWQCFKHCVILPSW